MYLTYGSLLFRAHQIVRDCLNIWIKEWLFSPLESRYCQSYTSVSYIVRGKSMNENKPEISWYTCNSEIIKLLQKVYGPR
jgi:hypothetical protein